MPRKASVASRGKPGGATRKRPAPKIQAGARPEPFIVGGDGSDGKPETTAIVLRISADRATQFEAMFEAEEIPIWEDFTREGRFLEARLVRAVGGSEARSGIHDYLLHMVAADHEAHEEHDRDPRFRAFLAKAERLQPEPPLVWFGDSLFERRS